jgi:hypothetical protein
MSVLIFTGSDQQMCCGQTFRVGDRVTWQVVRDVPRAHIARVLGDELADAVTHVDAIHADTPGAPLAGVVEGIDAVFYEERPLTDHPGGYTHEPVPGSSRLEPREQAIRSEEQVIEPIEWAGYIVRVSAE